MLLLSLLLACHPDEPTGRDTDTTPTDTDGGTDTDTTDTDTDTGPPPTGVVLINEVMSDNESTWQDVDDSLPDWVELYNPGPNDVQLADLRLSDDSGLVWRGGEGTLAVGGRLVLLADEKPDEGHLPFSLDKTGDKLTLTLGTEKADEVEIPELNSDVSWARIPDAGPSWSGTAAPTPDAKNGDLPTETLDPRDQALSDVTMHQLTFTMTTEQISRLDDASMMNETWTQSELTIDGIHYDAIRTRLKGSASFDNLDGKPAFKVDVNDVDATRRWKELKKFNLHNGNVYDPTRTHDSLSYQLARESGIMAPRVGWAEVYIENSDTGNTTYYGIYMIIEGYDDNLIESHYPGQGDLGALFEPNESQGGGWGGDFCSGDVSFQYESGPIPVDPLVLDALNATSAICGKSATDANIAELWNYVDKEGLLTYMAWETMINHSDGYKAPNNWRVYVDTAYKVHLVPSGAEWTWDGGPDPWYFGGRLASFCLQNTGCKRDYALELLEMADRVEDLDLLTRFEDLTTWLDPVIDLDPRSPHSDATVGQARQTTVDRLTGNPGDVRQDVEQVFPGL